ncbi:MAG: DMT family transporter [Paracoccaceae bacterium]
MRNLLYLVALGAGWGLTHPLSKIATGSGHPPFSLLFWQMVIVVLVLGGITLARRRIPPLGRRELRFYVVVAVLGTVVPNASFYMSMARLPAGVMSILTAAVPMIAFPLAILMGNDRFSPARLIGLLLGLAGVALIAAPGNGLSAGAIAVVPLALVGPLFYAMEANFVARNGMEGMDPVQAMAGASVVALALCLMLVLSTGQWTAPSLPPNRGEWALVLSSAIHALLYAGYIWLAAQTGAVFASQASYLITATGVLWAMALLGERFSLSVWVALVVMLSGVALVQPRPRAAPAG